MARLMMPSVPPFAAEIIERHQNGAPVKVGSIAKALGVNVIISDLPLAVSGMLSKNPDGESWTIRVNRHEHRHRQRYTIAHEIAHFVLHRDAFGDELVDDTFYRSGLSERREYEANSLAAEILMPWPLIKQLMKEGKTSAPELAASLQVSPAAMSIRLGLPT
jgi:Zn-dependent peptidase ImmA (M78 family)